MIVDSDVDIFDDSSVLRAFATRVKVGEDVFVIRNAKGHPLDLTATEGFLVEKVGIDATKPLIGYPETIAGPGLMNWILMPTLGERGLNERNRL